MDEHRTSPPSEPPRRSATDLRRAREAEALRENLRKRKQQQRVRETVEAEVPREKPPGDTTRSSR